LSSYILATVIFDLTVEFCRRWIDPRSRTTDQMIQAARSGKQNIAEGASVQSLESYIKLLGVTEGSQRELAADYEDFLRQRDLPIWDKDDPRVRQVREFRASWVKPNQPNTPNLPNDPELEANSLLTYCQMESFLLKRQIDALKEKFIREGGFRENLFRQRQEYRTRGEKS
jgi:restriction system protein